MRVFLGEAKVASIMVWSILGRTWFPEVMQDVAAARTAEDVAGWSDTPLPWEVAGSP